MHAYGARQGGIQSRGGGGGGGGGGQPYSVTGTEVTSTTVVVVTKVVVLGTRTTLKHGGTISGVSMPLVSFVWHKPLLASSMNRRDATIRVRMVDGVVKLPVSE